MKDTIFNFSDLLAFYSNEKDGNTGTDTLNKKEAFRYHLHDIELRGAQFAFENRDIRDTILLRDISFTIPYVGWDQEEKSEAGLRFNLEKEGYLEAGININPVNGEFDATLTLYRLYLESLQKYISSYADIGASSGVFSTRMLLRGNINQPEQSVLSGELELLDLYLADLNEKEFLGFEAIRMDIREIDPFNSYFYLDSLTLSKPYVYFEMKDSTNNFLDILNLGSFDTLSTKTIEPEQDSLSPQQKSPIYYAVQSFRMEQGVIDFRNYATGKPFDYHLSDIEIKADSIESNSEWLSLYASMLLNERGKLLSEIGFNPLSPDNFTLDYTISDFRLSDLNLYSRYYVGFPIVYGDMYYRGHTEVTNHQMLSDNKLIMDRVELGEKSQGLLDIPLKLALYILKDRHDVIELDIPVRGRTDDPQLKVGQIVWNTIKNRILGVVEAPYDYLAGMVGADPKELEAIEFGYADTTLTAEKQRQMDLLLELEQLKSELEIELVYYIDQDKEIEQILKADPGAVSADSVAFLYSDARMNKIRDFLHASYDSTSIRVIRSEIQDPLNKGSLPRFMVEYSMSEGLNDTAKLND